MFLILILSLAILDLFHKCRYNVIDFLKPVILVILDGCRNKGKPEKHKSCHKSMCYMQMQGFLCALTILCEISPKKERIIVLTV